MELLIAAAMMSILFVGLSAHLRGGIIVWQRATSITDRLQRERVALEQLERDLANAFVYDDRETSYGTDPGKLPTPIFGTDQLAWFMVQPPTREHSAVRFVRYACGEQHGIQGLWSTSQSVTEARVGVPQLPPYSLLPGCQSLSLQYAYLPAGQGAEPPKWEELVWTDQWLRDARKKLPRLVDVTIHLESSREIRRTFMIPTGVLEPQSVPAS